MNRHTFRKILATATATLVFATLGTATALAETPPDTGQEATTPVATTTPVVEETTAPVNVETANPDVTATPTASDPAPTVERNPF